MNDFNTTQELTMKRHSTQIFIAFLAILAGILGFNYFKQPFLKNFSSSNEAATLEEPSTITPTHTPKQSYFETLTPRQKAAQVLAVSLTLDDGFYESPSGDLAQATQEKLAWIQSTQPGMITLFGTDVSQDFAESSVGEIRSLFSDTAVQPLLAVDHEGGAVQRLNGEGFTVLPSWKDACAMETNEAQKLFQKSAQELADLGVSVVFAPVLDLAENHDVLQSRVCGDYVTTLQKAETFILAFSDETIMPVVKHFPGIGSVNADLHGAFETVDLNTQDTQAFKDILDRFPNIGVMTTHVGIEGIVDEIPCSLSEVCLGKLPSLYPEALFFTDALEMESARYQSGTLDLKPLPEVAKEAIFAGNNVLVFGENVSAQDFDEILNMLESEYTKSEEFQKKLDVSVAKILLLKKIDW